VLQLLRAARTRYHALPLPGRPAPHPSCLLGLLSRDEAAALARAGYSLRGRTAAFITAAEDPETITEGALCLLRTLARRPDLAAAFRAVLLGGDD
jgi:hypothetical protein